MKTKGSDAPPEDADVAEHTAKTSQEGETSVAPERSDETKKEGKGKKSPEQKKKKKGKKEEPQAKQKSQSFFLRNQNSSRSFLSNFLMQRENRVRKSRRKNDAPGQNRKVLWLQRRTKMARKARAKGAEVLREKEAQSAEVAAGAGHHPGDDPEAEGTEATAETDGNETKGKNIGSQMAVVDDPSLKVQMTYKLLC